MDNDTRTCLLKLSSGLTQLSGCVRQLTKSCPDSEIAMRILHSLVQLSGSLEQVDATLARPSVETTKGEPHVQN